ncbi:MAG: carbohydrate ABC transporter permease [Methylacidiphilales bacterium]|nr:carbohydrate ABC transporter permease [Candidatus Methylacidiphilales bacterium]
MKTRSGFNQIVVYLLLMAGSVIFLAPLAWMISTSLKPIEQTMTMPPVWLPKAYFAAIDGRRMEVTRDAEVSPGMWHVTEFSPGNLRTHKLLSAVVPASSIETRIQPRWSNYSKALATIGGQNFDVGPETVPERNFAANEDADVSFWIFLSNTLTICLLSVVGSVFSNALVAYGFARLKWPGRDWFFAATLATMMIPTPVLMVPIYTIFRSLGWIGTLQPLWVPAFFGGAFNIFLMRQFFLTIPEELTEAARIDGCSEWAIFWRIILPLSKPVLAVVALFTFLGGWNDFMGPLLYLTHKHTFTLALALQSYSSRLNGVQWNYLMAASAVIILPIVVLFFLTQKTFIRGIATTGIKG